MALLRVATSDVELGNGRGFFPLRLLLTSVTYKTTVNCCQGMVYITVIVAMD